MPRYDDYAPIPNKVLQPDGSITTFDGQPILPADEARATAYANEYAPRANKEINPDDSVTPLDSALGSGAGNNNGGGGYGTIPRSRLDFYSEVPAASETIIETIFDNTYPGIVLDYLNNMDGSTVPSESKGAPVGEYYVTGHIPVAHGSVVLPGTSVTITAVEMGDDFTWNFFDAEDELISSVDYQTYSYPITLPEGTAFVQTMGRRWEPNSVPPNAAISQTYIAPSDAVKYHDPGAMLYPSQIMVPRYRGKTLGCIGDSLTKAEGFTGWSRLIQDHFGFSSISFAGNGYIALGQRTTNQYNPAAPNNTYKPMILRPEDLAANCEAVLFFPGVSELMGSQPLGSWDDPLTVDDTHFVVNWIPALRVLCQKLRNRFPGKPLFCILPLQLAQNVLPSLSLWREYIAAAKEVCMTYGVRTINPADAGLALYFMTGSEYSTITTDGTHLTNEGHRRLADEIIRAMV